ncbi:MAG: hypothetical protein IJU76_07890 [Desulfovibrionaceae bacterium]|nr:hypothetical protein [Desulfovibrionaceae bacterium]
MLNWVKMLKEIKEAEAERGRQMFSFKRFLFMGIGRLFDFTGSYNRSFLFSKLGINGLSRDRQALQRDVIMICGDMRKAETKMRRTYEKNHKKARAYS